MFRLQEVNWHRPGIGTSFSSPKTGKMFDFCFMLTFSCFSESIFNKKDTSRSMAPQSVNSLNLNLLMSLKFVCLQFKKIIIIKMIV